MKPNQRSPWGMSHLLFPYSPSFLPLPPSPSLWLGVESKLTKQPSDLPQDGSPHHWSRMLCSQTLDVTIQTTTHLDNEGVCSLFPIKNHTDGWVDPKILSHPSLDQVHYSHQMNSLLLGISPPHRMRWQVGTAWTSETRKLHSILRKFKRSELQTWPPRTGGPWSSHCSEFRSQSYDD